MRLGRFLQSMFLMTILALVYTHMQMQIFELAYLGKSKQKKVGEIKEDITQLTYRILQMKSSHHLGGKLLAENSSLQFRDNNSVVQLVTADDLAEPEEEVSALQQKRVSSLLSFLSLRPPAQAQANEKVDQKNPWLRGNR